VVDEVGGKSITRSILRNVMLRAVVDRSIAAPDVQDPSVAVAPSG